MSPEAPTNGDTAGRACVDLIAWPERWINRRVETIELLSREETRRRISIDCSITDTLREQLLISDGVVLPITVLSKEPRRNFHLRSESGAAVPVLGREQNGMLTHLAACAAAEAVLRSIDDDQLYDDLAEIVFGSAEQGEVALAKFATRAEDGDAVRAAILGDETCLRILDVCAANYVLFAVVEPNTANRRVLKCSYGEEFPLDRPRGRQRFAFEQLTRTLTNPDRATFIIDCPMAWRAASFHVEVAIPQELVIETAALWVPQVDELIGPVEQKVNRAALYAADPVPAGLGLEVIAEVAAERRGKPTTAAGAAVIVAGLLGAGVASGLDATNPGAANSLLLALAAVYVAVIASRPEPRLVQAIFGASRRWLTLVAAAALIAASSLAFELPAAQPVCVWVVCGLVAAVGAVRLIWSAVRAPV